MYNKEFDMIALYEKLYKFGNVQTDKNRGRPSKQRGNSYILNGGIKAGKLSLMTASRQCGKSTYASQLAKMILNSTY
jgi:hypothetical protein